MLSSVPLDSAYEALFLDTTLTGTYTGDSTTYSIDDSSLWSSTWLAYTMTGLINANIITGWSVANGDDGLLVVAGTTGSSLYYYLEGDGYTTSVSDSELSLITTMDYVLTSSNVDAYVTIETDVI